AISPTTKLTTSVSKICSNKRVTTFVIERTTEGHEPVTHAGQPSAPCTAMLTLPTYAIAAMLKSTLPIALLPAINVSGSASHVSVPLLLLCVRQMMCLYAQPRFTPQTLLLDAISEFQFSLATANHTTVTEPEKRVVLVQEDAKETASWLFPKNSDYHNNNNNQNNELLFIWTTSSPVNTINLDINKTASYQRKNSGDRVVPLQLEETRGNLRNKQQNITYGSSGSQYNNNGSINHNAYNPSMETDFVPEQTAPDTTVSHPKTHKGKTAQLPEPLIQILSPMDREARVLRYREKKKRRKV
ncbi:LOW QUALITY PROTEIN: hypothetical protein HID58_090065, partial [Brassica napus]